MLLTIWAIFLSISYIHIKKNLPVERDLHCVSEVMLVEGPHPLRFIVHIWATYSVFGKTSVVYSNIFALTSMISVLAPFSSTDWPFSLRYWALEKIVIWKTKQGVLYWRWTQYNIFNPKRRKNFLKAYHLFYQLLYEAFQNCRIHDLLRAKEIKNFYLWFLICWYITNIFSKDILK